MRTLRVARWKVVCGVAVGVAGVAAWPLVQAMTEYNQDIGCVVVDVDNSSGRPLRGVVVTCAAKNWVTHRRSLGGIAPGDGRTARIPVTASAATNFVPEYTVTLRFAGPSGAVASRTTGRHRGSWVTFTVLGGGKVDTLMGED